MVFPESAPVQQICSVPSGAHFVQIYDSNDVLIEGLFAFFKSGFDEGEVAIVIATRAHRAALEAKLGDNGYDPVKLKAAGKYVAFDAAETLGMFMHEGRPEAFRFNALLGGLLKSATRAGSGVRAFGEMVAILWDEGDRAGAIDVEKLWNALGEEYRFTLFCAYRKNQFSTAEDRAAFPSVCSAHSIVIGSEA